MVKLLEQKYFCCYYSIITSENHRPYISKGRGISISHTALFTKTQQEMDLACTSLAIEV